MLKWLKNIKRTLFSRTVKSDPMSQQSNYNGRATTPLINIQIGSFASGTSGTSRPSALTTWGRSRLKGEPILLMWKPVKLLWKSLWLRFVLRSTGATVIIKDGGLRVLISSKEIMSGENTRLLRLIASWKEWSVGPLESSNVQAGLTMNSLELRRLMVWPTLTILLQGSWDGLSLVLEPFLLKNTNQRLWAMYKKGI